MRKQNDLDDDEIIGDGQSVRVPMWLTDAAARDYQPHFGNAPAAVRDARRAARDAYVSALTQAWRRTPGHHAGQPDNSSPAAVMRARLRTEPDDNAQARRERAYRNYCDELSRAWQRGRTDPRAATAVERQRRTYTYQGGR